MKRFGLRESYKLIVRISVGRFMIHKSELDDKLKNDECCVCTGLLTDHESISHCGCDDAPVKHWLHFKCLMTWLHTSPTCPLCRYPVKVVVSGSSCFICNATNAYTPEVDIIQLKCCETILHAECYLNPAVLAGGLPCFRCGTVSDPLNNFVKHNPKTLPAQLAKLAVSSNTD